MLTSLTFELRPILKYLVIRDVVVGLNRTKDTPFSRGHLPLTRCLDPTSTLKVSIIVDELDKRTPIILRLYQTREDNRLGRSTYLF